MSSHNYCSMKRSEPKKSLVTSGEPLSKRRWRGNNVWGPPSFWSPSRSHLSLHPQCSPSSPSTGQLAALKVTWLLWEAFTGVPSLALCSCLAPRMPCAAPLRRHPSHSIAAACSVGRIARLEEAYLICFCVPGTQKGSWHRAGIPTSQ